jgi:hypothetical protein
VNQREAAKLAEVLEMLEQWTWSTSDRVIPVEGHTKRQGEEQNASDYIREHSRVWRESWILPTLRELVNRYHVRKPGGGS